MELKKEALASQERVLPPNHPDIATTRGTLVSSYSNLGRHSEAVAEVGAYCASGLWSPAAASPEPSGINLSPLKYFFS